MSGKNGDLFFDILIAITRNVSINGTIIIAKDTAGAAPIANGVVFTIFNSLNCIIRVEITIPIINEPLSPINSLLELPKTLKRKKPARLPIKANDIIES